MKIPSIPSSSPADLQTPVLIIGGGLAGLTTALMLAFRGIRPLLVERHATTSTQPRARGINYRTMELLRVAGLEEELCEAAGGVFRDFEIVVSQTVSSPPFKTILPRGSWDTAAMTPAKMAGLGQEKIEPILRRRAEEFGADLRFATELVSLEQDEHGVSAVIRDRNTLVKQTVRTEYVVAADGNRSPLRKLLGIGVHGIGAISNFISILFQTDTPLPTRGRGFALYYLQNPAFNGAFITTDDQDVALVTLEYDPTKETEDDFTPERCTQMVRAALGMPEIEVRIRNVSSWEMSSRVADQFQKGRVFLAGDAAHTMPPTGGLGGQTAMQDSYDIAWKLAMVLQGMAGSELLDTYEAERKPVAEITVAVQTQNYIERMRPDRSDLAQGKPTLDYVAVLMGYRYRSAAILADDIFDDGAPTEDPMQPTGRPGTRGAHVELIRDGEKISTLDLIGKSFVLFTGRQGNAWTEAGVQVALRLGVPLAIHRLGKDLEDPSGKWNERYGVSDQGAVLIRPDGYIAWRAKGRADNPAAVLEDALSRILFLPLDSEDDSAKELVQVQS